MVHPNRREGIIGRKGMSSSGSWWVAEICGVGYSLTLT